MPNGNGGNGGSDTQPDPTMVPSTQTYYAKSVLNDGQTWFNIVTFLTSLVAIPEVMAFVPTEHRLTVVRAIMAFIAVGNVYTRIFHVRRPVAFIKSGDAKPVEVKTLTPTAKSEKC